MVYFAGLDVSVIPPTRRPPCSVAPRRKLIAWRYESARRGLSAGGSGIRTLGPAKMVRRFEATPVDLHLTASFRETPTYFVRGIDVSNPGPSSGESTNFRFLLRRCQPNPPCWDSTPSAGTLTIAAMIGLRDGSTSPTTGAHSSPSADVQGLCPIDGDPRVELPPKASTTGSLAPRD